MKRTALDDVLFWNVWQPDRRIDFNGFAWLRPDGNVLFDPMPLLDGGADTLAELGGARFVLVTNADHYRASESFATTHGATIVAPAPDRDRFGDARVDVWFDDAGDLPEPLRDSVEVHWIRGGKSPAEAAFYLPTNRALVVGDALRSHATGTLDLLPAPKLHDRDLVVRDLREIGKRNVEALLLGDGDPVFHSARSLLLPFLTAIA